MTKREYMMLTLGDEVEWDDPDNGLCSCKGTIIEIVSPSGLVEGHDTVVVLETESGGTTEVFVHELK